LKLIKVDFDDASAVSGAFIIAGRLLRR
jgi:hypothetical protein